MSSYDSVISSYVGSVAIKNDRPKGTILAEFPVNARNALYANNAITAKIYSDKATLNSMAETTNAVVTVVWIYK